jgi:hypothetical protein
MDAGEEAGPAGGGSNLRSRSGYPCHRPDRLCCVVGPDLVEDRPCSAVSFPSASLRAAGRVWGSCLQVSGGWRGGCSQGLNKGGGPRFLILRR